MNLNHQSPKLTCIKNHKAMISKSMQTPDENFYFNRMKPDERNLEIPEHFLPSLNIHYILNYHLS